MAGVNILLFSDDVMLVRCRQFAGPGVQINISERPDIADVLKMKYDLRVTGGRYHTDPAFDLPGSELLDCQTVEAGLLNLLDGFVEFLLPAGEQVGQAVLFGPDFEAQKVGGAFEQSLPAGFGEAGEDKTYLPPFAIIPVPAMDLTQVRDVNSVLMEREQFIHGIPICHLDGSRTTVNILAEQGKQLFQLHAPPPTDLFAAWSRYRYAKRARHSLNYNKRRASVKRMALNHSEDFFLLFINPTIPTVITVNPINCPPGLSSISPYTTINAPNNIARMEYSILLLFI